MTNLCKYLGKFYFGSMLCSKISYIFRSLFLQYYAVMNNQTKYHTLLEKFYQFMCVVS